MVLFSIKSRKSQPRSRYKMLAVQVPIKLKLLFKGLCPQRLFLIVPNEERASAAAGGRPEKRRFYERFESKNLSLFRNFLLDDILVLFVSCGSCHPHTSSRSDGPMSNKTFMFLQTVRSDVFVTFV